MAQALRLASEEVALSGQTFRVRFRQHSYQFQSLDREGAWQTLQTHPYQEYRFAEGIQVLEIRPQMPLTEETDDVEKGSEPVLADILLSPEGIRKIVDIVLSDEPASARPVIVLLRPGPGGIGIDQELK